MFFHRYITSKNYTEVFADSLGEIVFKLRIIITGALIFFYLNRRYSILSGFTVILFPIIKKKPFLMQDLIEEKAEKANSWEQDSYIWISTA